MYLWGKVYIVRSDEKPTLEIKMPTGEGQGVGNLSPMNEVERNKPRMKRGLVKSIEQNNRFLKFGPFDSRVLLKDFPVPSFCPLLSKGIFSFQIWMADLGAGAVAQSLSHTQPGCCESRYRASLRAAMYAENLA